MVFLIEMFNKAYYASPVLVEDSKYELEGKVGEFSDDYFDDIITVFGHTPTMNYGEQYRNKIIKTKTWIDIDMGAADGKTEPVLLRLDDMKEFRN